jgi:ribosomal-protein-alanine N-acetyltransferase
MSVPRIRPVESPHIADLLHIASETHLNYWSAESYLDEIKKSNSIMFRVEADDNRTLGFIVGRVVPAADDAAAVDADIYNIGVENPDQRRGLGQLLLDAFTSECQRQSVRSIWLEVRESNDKARSFYLKNGFVPVTLRKGFYADPPESAIVMRRFLDPGTRSLPSENLA